MKTCGLTQTKLYCYTVVAIFSAQLADGDYVIIIKPFFNQVDLIEVKNVFLYERPAWQQQRQFPIKKPEISKLN